MIANSHQCLGVRDSNEHLICWCLTYEDGSMGMFHTREVSYCSNQNLIELMLLV
jgi:hypothetical protein